MYFNDSEAENLAADNVLDCDTLQIRQGGEMSLHKFAQRACRHQAGHRGRSGRGYTCARLIGSHAEDGAKRHQ